LQKKINFLETPQKFTNTKRIIEKRSSTSLKVTTFHTQSDRARAVFPLTDALARQCQSAPMTISKLLCDVLWESALKFCTARARRLHSFAALEHNTKNASFSSPLI
jgi:hypothetical protein